MFLKRIKSLMTNRNQRQGFTMVEVLAALFAGMVVVLGAGSVILIMAKNNQTFNDTQTASTNEMEVRNTLREVAQDGSPKCTGYFNSLLTPANLQSMIQAGIDQRNNKLNSLQIPLKNASGNYVDFVNPMNSASVIYGNLTIVDVELSNFRIAKDLKGYSLPSTSLFNKPSIKPSVMYVLAGQVKTSLGKIDPVSLKPVISATSTVNVNFAVNNAVPATPALLDCGVGSLARTTAFVESCKAFGVDYEFVYDKTATDPKIGQCYMPVYDASIGANPVDGKTRMAPTGFAPFRYFLCAASFAGKSLNFPFCTGAF